MTSRGKSSTALAAALLAALTVVVYLPALRAGFVFDDEPLITQNPMVKAQDGLHQFWFTTQAPDYYPLTWSFWWLEWRWWDTRAFGYHAVNVLLHAVDAILLWLILRRLKLPAAWLVAALFAIHPVNVATVAWISEQKSTLSMLFYALAILWYLKFDDADRLPEINRGTWAWYSLSLTAFLLALLSKTAVAMLPVVLLACIWWRRGTVRGKDVFCVVPFFVVALILGLVTIWFQYHHSMEDRAVLTGGLAARLAMASRVPWFYLSKALVPVGLTVAYPQWEIDAPRWSSYVPGAVLIGGLVVLWWKRGSWGRPWLFGLGYFVVTLFPVLGFFDQAFYRHSLVADHWQYYSIIGVIALVVGAARWIGHRLHLPGRPIGWLISAVVLLGLGAATWTRSGVYANNETLWQDNVTRNPDAWLAHNDLGVALNQAGKFSDAIGHFEQALRLKPDFAEAHNNLGNALFHLGHVQEAIGQYERALQLSPRSVSVHFNLGIALEQAGRAQDAITQYEQALQTKPDYAEAHYNLGNLLSQQGNPSEAIAQYQQALRLDPHSAQAHYNLGNVLFHLNQSSQAIQQWELAVQAKPDFAEAHFNLGNALLRAGQLQEASRHYMRAVQIRPDYVEAHYNLGMALMDLGRFPEAAEHLEQALRLRPNYPEGENNLGVALQRVGRTQEAIACYDKALQLKPDYVEARFNLAVALEQTGRIDDAIRQYEQVLQLKPDSTEARNRLTRLQPSR